MIALLAFLAASFFLDDIAAAAVKEIQSGLITAAVDAFNRFYIWIYVAFLAASAAAILKAKTKENKARNILATASSILMAITATHILKLIIQRGRPDGMPFLNPLFGTTDYSFPSGHTTAAAAGLFSAPTTLRLSWLAFTLVTIFSRLYANKHFLSDTIAGLIVAFAVAAFVKSRLKENPNAEDWLELRRQLVHLAIGLAIAWLAWKYGFAGYALIAAAAAGILLSYTIKTAAIVKNAAAKRLRNLAVAALGTVERKDELQRFPGRGAIMLFLGSGITAAIFSKEIAVAAILVLAVGDSMSHLAGRLIGKTRHKWPFIEEKMAEGTVAGIVFASAVAAIIHPAWQAIASSAAAMTVEALHIKILGRRIDDNLTVPVVAAVVLRLLGLVSQ